MSGPQKLPTEIFSLLIENGDGVTEFFIRADQREGAVAYQTIHASVASGQFRPLRSEQLARALSLEQWAQNSEAVFSEGRVVY